MRLLALMLFVSSLTAQTSTLAGDWVITVSRFNEPETRRLKIEFKDGKYIAKDRDLDFAGTLKNQSIDFRCSYKDEDQLKECGNLTGTLQANRIEGSGKIFGDTVTWSAIRDVAVSGAPERHEFVPTAFYRQFNGNIAPVMHVKPGDSIHTKTVDAGGTDEAGVKRSQGGNPLTGPFYVDGALPGDTLVIRLDRVRLNRDSANIFNDSVVAPALEPYSLRDMKRQKDFDSSWKLDREKGTATLTKPTGPLKNFAIKLQPMLGCIGVAPADHQAFRSGNLGRYGGNMDYNQVREGATVYLPVFQTGALLFVGDGHAAQGDGELTGNALETSMDVEFTVDLLRGKSLGQPRFENSEYVMVSGIAGSLNEALQMATSGMSQWLENEYKLNTAEIAMVLTTSMHYDIAEVVDPQVHLVAKVAKSALAQISRP